MTALVLRFPLQHPHASLRYTTSFATSTTFHSQWRERLVTAVANQAAGTWLLAPGTWQLAPGSWHLAPGTWQLAPGTWHLAPGSWHLNVEVAG